ncbi:sigma-70 family RNA polymerase sigma factor [Evansella cellulosilytica]|uniref:Sigma-70 family RNA polymerase sigma factor n=1 Tax=Evansella cellulosilytica (strain ATCC 21833 / DSM 2522 / FERM P-1141 / JCM 9156 / N-4) TaxID=649639 RepID=E6TVH7_EVAC2|nr:sigma-70 family RNA polymerase sigma factor [Evansella cellulosilytica]ADU30994.1 hypothetical protein Bcell_2739 [Evansella cellulosilytica DSM 2522]
MLTDEEKHDLVLRYQYIVYDIAYHYRFLDRDIEDIRGWGYVGLVNAINDFEKCSDIDLKVMAYPRIKREILKQYSKRPSEKEISIQKEVFTGKNGSSKTLEEYLTDEHQSYYNESDIYSMLEQALITEEELLKKVTLDYLLREKDIASLSSIYEIPKQKVTRYCRRGKTIIKQFLINNGIIRYQAREMNENKIKEKKQRSLKNINNSDYGKIKYLRKYFPYLNFDDIASLIGTSSFCVSEIIDYPTATYLRATLDGTIKDQALEYCKKKYPNRIPGDVTVFKVSMSNNIT